MRNHTPCVRGFACARASARVRIYIYNYDGTRMRACLRAPTCTCMRVRKTTCLDRRLWQPDDRYEETLARGEAGARHGQHARAQTHHRADEQHTQPEACNTRSVHRCARRLYLPTLDFTNRATYSHRIVWPKQCRRMQHVYFVGTHNAI